jgi:DNA-binding NarL/FixJ family response regulator
MSGAVRIVVADGHPMYRRGLAALLASHPGWAVVAQEDTGAGTLDAALRTRPELVVMDIDLPHPPAAETARRITAELPEAAILVLTSRDDGAAMAGLFRAGARGCLAKTDDRSSVVRAVSAAVRGDALLPAAAARHVLDDGPALTSREQEVLELVGAGWGTEDIAKVMVLDPTSVRDHVTAIVEKVRAVPPAEEAPAPGPVPPGTPEPPPRVRRGRRGRRR